MSTTVDIPVYLQVEPERNNYFEGDSIHSVTGGKVVGTTQRKSRKPRPGTVEVKVTLRIPKAAFIPLRPEAVIVIPESFTQPHPIEVEAQDINQEDNA